MDFEIHSMVLSALEKAAQQADECRLLAAGKTKPGLLLGTKSRARDAAQEQCLDERLGLFRVRTAHEPKGKTSQAVHWVMLTKRGIEVLLERKPIEEHEDFLEKVAVPHKEAATKVAFSIAERRLAESSAERERLARQEEELLDSLRRLAEDRLKALADEKARLDRILRCVSDLISKLTGGGRA